MDTISHGIWSLILYFKHPKKWWAVLLGVSPDFIAFGPHFIAEYGLGMQVLHGTMYKITHSLVILAIVVLIIWAFTKTIPWLAGAWGLHTVIDMFTHPVDFYPTPFLFPFPNPAIPALDYRTLWFNIVNIVIMTSLLTYLVYRNVPKATKN